MRNLIELTVMQLFLPLWHFLHLHDKIELKMSQISPKNAQKERKKITPSMGFEPGTALGVVSIIET